ncbi:MAG TPA: class I SAM-dependent methyltransferase [Candidatus Sulfotelmatobacter sp.]|nr:class I SAM-dependent methyltransferase [Candidatus Sulfotelmatobacter sp.]
MNALENWFCSTGFWQRITRDHLLPWVVAGNPLGNHVLELGAGPGAGTEALQRLAPRVTSLEWSHAFATRLAAKNRNAVVQGDASSLPFVDRTFSSVIAVLMLHHLRTRASQENAFREACRVLRPGGSFLAFEIEDNLLHRVIHIGSVFVPIDRADIADRLSAAGFTGVKLDSRAGGFRFCAMREN